MSDRSTLILPYWKIYFSKIFVHSSIKLGEIFDFKISPQKFQISQQLFELLRTNILNRVQVLEKVLTGLR